MAGETNRAVLMRSFFRAASNGNVAELAAALEQGLHVNSLNSNQWSALHEAARVDHAEAVELLLSSGADPNIRQSQTGFTPLIVATFKPGQTSTVRALLRGGAAPSLGSKTGMAPLHNAAKNEDFEVARLLLEAGADPIVFFGQFGTLPDGTPKPNPMQHLVDEFEQTPKQSRKEAELAAERTHNPPPPRFKEFAPLAVEKLTVVGSPRRVEPEAVSGLAEALGGEWPSGYSSLMEQLGPGWLKGTFRVYSPERIQADRQAWLKRIDEHWFWGEELITREKAQEAVLIADSMHGDEYIFLPSDPEVILMLPHEGESSILISRKGLLCALAKLVATRSGRKPKTIKYEVQAGF